MKVLLLCILIGSIAAIDQPQKDFQEVATSRDFVWRSSGCIDSLPAIYRNCRKLKLACPRLKSQCNKTLKQVVGNSKWGKQCRKKIKRGDANKKIYEFCAGSCTMCRDGQWTAWESTDCTKSCGSDGIQTKTRTCNNPAPAGKGNPCVGPSSVTKGCELKPCPNNADCQDMNNGATDEYGDDCAYYNDYPENCGDYDDDDFTANAMCCACKSIDDFCQRTTCTKSKNEQCSDCPADACLLGSQCIHYNPKWINNNFYPKQRFFQGCIQKGGTDCSDANLETTATDQPRPKPEPNTNPAPEAALVDCRDKSSYCARFGKRYCILPSFTSGSYSCLKTCELC